MNAVQRIVDISRMKAPFSALVLVVEDEPLVRLDAVDMLTGAGFRVVDATNADEAIAILERRRDIRVVVTDIQMPGSMDGLKLAAMIRDRWPPIQLIVISGKVGVQAGQLPPGAKFIAKPYHEPTLLNLVQSLIVDRGATT